MARQTSKWLKQMTVDIAYTYAISSKTQKLSVQPNILICNCLLQISERCSLSKYLLLILTAIDKHKVYGLRSLNIPIRETSLKMPGDYIVSG
jgi:hypothetical protein